jgi:hypothetical protein
MATPTPTRRKKKVVSPGNEDRVTAPVVATPRTGTPQHRLKIVRAGVKSLKPYRDNPRRGNVAAIMESLLENGQYRPIVVWRKTREILAGNHTWQAACELGWEFVDVVYVDVSEEEAAKIVLADNRTNDLATYDMEALHRVLDGVQSAVGTGYSQIDKDMLTRVAATAAPPRELIDSIVRPTTAEQDERLPSMTEVFSKTGGAQTDPHVAGEVHVEDLFDDASDELAGIVDLKDVLDFKAAGMTFGDNQIPVVRGDRLIAAATMPASILMYVPMLYKDWPDPDQWWMVRYRGTTDSAGLRNPQNAILSFMTWDEHFDNWWDAPASHVIKLLNSRIGFSMAPDFSVFNDVPRIEAVWAIYKQRWMARYMQEAGVTVMPHLNWLWGDRPFIDDYVLPTLPPHLPTVLMENQNALQELLDDADMRKAYLADVAYMYQHLQPEVLVVYAGEAGTQMLYDLGLPWRIIQVDTFAKAMNDTEGARRKRAEAEARVSGLVVPPAPAGRRKKR